MIAEVPSTPRSFVDDSCIGPQSTNFCTYQISAVNISGEGPLSLSVPSVPEAPRIATLSGPDKGQITVSWSPVRNGGRLLTGYRVYRGSQPWDLTLYAELAASATSFIDQGLADGARYYYRMSAINELGEGPASNPPVAGSAPELPAAPYNVVATPYSSFILLTPMGNQISWEAPYHGGSSLLGYRVYRSGDAGPQLIAETSPSQRYYQDYSCPAASICYYTVSAYTAAGEGASSSAAIAPGWKS